MLKVHVLEDPMEEVSHDAAAVETICHLVDYDRNSKA